MKNLSALELLEELKSSFVHLDTTVENLRLLLKNLSFGWLNTHSAYNDAIWHSPRSSTDTISSSIGTCSAPSGAFCLQAIKSFLPSEMEAINIKMSGIGMG